MLAAFAIALTIVGAAFFCHGLVAVFRDDMGTAVCSAYVGSLGLIVGSLITYAELV